MTKNINNTKTVAELIEDIKPEATFSPNDLADLFGADPKAIRRTIRANTAPEDRPGRGGSWIIQGSDVARLYARMGRAGTGRTVTASFIDKD